MRENEISPALLYFNERLGNPTSIQLHTDATQKAVVRQGVQILPMQVFFDQPLDSRAFWEKRGALIRLFSFQEHLKCFYPRRKKPVRRDLNL